MKTSEQKPVSKSSIVKEKRQKKKYETEETSLSNIITLRKQVEDKIAKLSIAVEQSADIIFITNSEGVIEYVNRAFEVITGYSKVDVIDKTPRILKSGLMDEKYYQKVWATIRSGKVLRAEVIDKRKNGEIFFYDQTITPLKNADGDVNNFISTGKDITERKLAEKERNIALKEIEMLSRFPSENPNPILRFNNDGILLYANEAAKEFLNFCGCSVGHIAPLLMYDLIKGAIIKGTNQIIEMQFGDRIWLMTFIPLIADAYVNLYCTDITERKQVEEDLRESEERYSTIVKNSPNLILIHVNDIIKYVNNIGEILLEYPREETIGKSILDFVSEESKPIVLDSMQRRSDGEDVPSYEVTVISKSGAEKSALIQATIIHYQKEKAFLAVITDISEIKKYERELELSKDKAEEMNRLKSSFLANMSHELRTPMIGILGFSKLLANSEDADTKETGGLIYTSGKRLMETLNLILDLSRIEAGESKLELSDIDLIEEIAEMVNLYQATAKEKNLLLSLNNTQYEHLYTRTDKKAIDSILNNLINNAVKYTYKGSITVSVAKDEREAEDWAIIEVTDTGIGIEKKDINMIFREFRQVSEGLERSFDGTGLGLTLTKKYIELIGGIITVKSKINEGSIFTVSFPIVPVLFENDELPADKEIIQNVIQKEITIKKNILIVEDDKVTIMYVKRILKDKYNMDTAMNAMEAIEHVEKKQYDLILMDINLGRSRNGIFTTKEIRKMNNYKDTPIIAMTAFAMKGDKEDFLAKGCSYYISKPFEDEELIELLEIALEQKKAD